MNWDPNYSTLKQEKKLYNFEDIFAIFTSFLFPTLLAQTTEGMSHLKLKFLQIDKIPKLYIFQASIQDGHHALVFRT